ncbi:MAG: hypothetical protein CVV64_13725 [Candidatus Wallbacteria bacterium HGW-Wallbacteria-1]|jgi:predicted ribosomally synthesized peptide with nif11-like leader|uniref:Nif11 domain-containing protein n=1 Tax=Candidatus Wallbacteria bacterium HGW-Wallbacteria-1 TaxID=2013854 RepID=A0A2N1PMA5_9BACT|nr:MAG: hypothetical protein CVV64_13725 [Candidatus Wallbacteria bacterium HGW-Wallbacteria-1]
MESMFNFIEKIKKDKTLSAKLERLNSANDRDGIVTFMRENGVSEDDITKGLEYENSFMTAETSELSDDDLESVAGGKSGSPEFPGLPKNPINPNFPDPGPSFPPPRPDGPFVPMDPGIPNLCRLFHNTPGGPCSGLHWIA